MGSAVDTNDNDGAGEICQLTDKMLSLWHVVDSAISHNKHDVVREPANLRGKIVLELSKQRREASEASLLNAREWRSVQVNDPLDTDNARVSWVSIDGETVADRHVGQGSTKAVNWVELVCIIRLNNLAYVQNSFLIGVVFA